MPLEHYYGVMADQFGVLPSDIMREEARLPVGFLDQVLEYRNFAHAVAANAADAGSYQSSPMRVLAMEIEAGFAAQVIKEATRGQ